MSIEQDKQLQRFKERGYQADLLPKTKKQQTWGTFNYFTLWMGSVHNVPNYVAVGGFFFLGIAPQYILLAIFFSSIMIAGIMILNGKAGSRYGIPFAMSLRASYGEKGALLPGILRGCIAAIMWYGLQTYTGSLALLILIGKIWPAFLHIGGNFQFLGISLPGLIAFIIFWVLNLLIGLGGGSILTKFTALLNPLIYILFGGMTIWALSIGGGLRAILMYLPQQISNEHSSLIVFFMIVNANLAVWAAPGVSASDFTQHAKNFKSQALGQFTGLVLSYSLFAFSSVTILAGASIHYGVDTWNILDIVTKWDHLAATAFATLVLLLTTISTNATGNIIPAGYQLAATFPKKISYKQGVLIASVLSFLICPWKLMENQVSIYTFLEIIGGILGPVLGVMLAHYFVAMKQTLSLDKLYLAKGKTGYYKNGVNWFALAVTLVATLLSFIGKLIPSLAVLSGFSWMIGSFSAFILYCLAFLLFKSSSTLKEEIK
ncbi:MULTISPECIES: allantoin transporter [Carnobacterium]|uniref:allantoin transporter n=1 Tax=Carnobacterium TaxID=2747 RepID=UPI00288FD172|nr:MULTISPECIES: putative allantoin permease [Carnobacterium]MDT1938829.1 putative allantoin permease [Carnobacterium divergens]MDT1941267.1 putative allantoin permease [Carnobacterium divergens]MDT1947065.1 putative allantoin permease [Carnobacterium divergens]MDT1949503.1 putative allantoin permease [Carnobacterium divergens]MDT1954681.1 putative allantoin permease [Carnobacterium divergens]